MAREKMPVQVRLFAETKDRLDRECRARGVSLGEIVEAALESFFDPHKKEEAQFEIILKQCAALRELIIKKNAELELTLSKISLQKQAPPQDETEEKTALRIATDEEVYGPYESWQVEDTQHMPPAYQEPTKPRLLRRLFSREHV